MPRDARNVSPPAPEPVRVPSSKARSSIKPLLTQCCADKVVIELEVHKQVAAILTTEAPDPDRTPAIRLGVEEARQNWSQVLEAVTVKRARYFFEDKKGARRVYLLKAQDYHNPYADQWSEAVRAFKARTAQQEAPEDLQERIEALEENLKAQIDALKNLIITGIRRISPTGGEGPPASADCLDRTPLD